MIVCKWGGSLLTNKGARAAPRFAKARASRLAHEWAEALAGQPAVLVHGAGSFGHPQALRHRIGKIALRGPTLRKAILEVRSAVEALQAGVVNALRDAGLPAVAVPAHFMADARGGRVRLRPAPILELLDHGFHPVTGGDVIFDDRLGARILSGDDLVVQLARATRARRAIYATDVDGLHLEGRLVLELPAPATPKAIARIGTSRDATGGMRGKLEAAYRLQRLGVETWIVNGRRKGRLSLAVHGTAGAGSRLPPA